MRPDPRRAKAEILKPLRWAAGVRRSTGHGTRRTFASRAGVEGRHPQRSRPARDHEADRPAAGRPPPDLAPAGRARARGRAARGDDPL